MCQLLCIVKVLAALRLKKKSKVRPTSFGKSKKSRIDSKQAINFHA